MCEVCWTELYDRSKDLPPNGDEIADVIRELYAHPRGELGGPLHAKIEDFNIEGEWKPFNDFTDPKHRYPDDLVEISQRVCDAMNPLSEAQRAAVVARFEGWF